MSADVDANTLMAPGVSIETLDASGLPPTSDRARPPDLRGLLIGRYVVISQVGAGSMGVVYAAFDPELDRKVALKLLRHRGEDLSGSRERLQREAQALAKLEHPNVITVHDVGVHAGQLFVAMEFVEGPTLGAWMAETELPRPWPEIVAVFAQAGRGLAAAHEAGMVHRDFKPDNVMIRADGIVRVMDFGLVQADAGGETLDGVAPEARGPASRRDGGEGSVDALTQTGSMFGTPAYMSGEQFHGARVDARSDQFSFCVALYEALYGERPFAGNTIGALCHAVLEEQIRAAPAHTRVPSWLRATVVRGLACDPDARFESMAALLAALADDPAIARRRWLIRIGLGLGLVASAWGITLVSQLEQRDEVIEDQANQLEIKNDQLERQLAELMEKDRAQTQLLSIQRGQQAKLLVSEGNEGRALSLAIQALGPYASEWSRAPREAVEGLEYVLAHDTVVLEASAILDEDPNYVATVAYSADGDRLVTASLGGKARIRDASTGATLSILADGETEVHAARFAPDGARVLTTHSDFRSRLWDASSGERIATLEGHRARIYTMQYAPDGAQVATASQDGSARIWSATTGALVATLDHGSEVFSLAYTPDGARIATASGAGTVEIWDARTGRHLASLDAHDGAVVALGYSPDGTRLATGGVDHQARIWDAASGELLRTLEGHKARVSALAYAPKGAQLATGSWDGSAKVWDVTSGALVRTFAGQHTSGIPALAYSPDGRLVATASFRGATKVWRVADGEVFASLEGHTQDVWDVAFSPSGDQLATASADGSARLWPLETRVVRLESYADAHDSLNYTPDRRLVVTRSYDETLGKPVARVWDAASGAQRFDLGGDTGVLVSDIGPDGVQLVTTGEDGVARTWSLGSGEQLATFAPDDQRIDWARYVAGGRRLVTNSHGPGGGELAVWDAETGALLHTLALASETRLIALSPDGAWLAAADRPDHTQIWALGTGVHRPTIDNLGPRRGAPQFSPDSRQIAIAHTDSSVTLVEVGTDTRLDLTGHSSYVSAMRYSPDGTRIATGGSDQSLKLWDASSGELLADHRDHRHSIIGIAYSPDGRLLATSSIDKTVRLRDADSGETLRVFDVNTANASRLIFSLDGAELTAHGGGIAARRWDVETGELLTRERIGMVEPDGSTAWPVSPRELTRIACARLRIHEQAYADVRDICAPLAADSL